MVVRQVMNNKDDLVVLGTSSGFPDFPYRKVGRYCPVNCLYLAVRSSAKKGNDQVIYRMEIVLKQRLVQIRPVRCVSRSESRVNPVSQYFLGACSNCPLYIICQCISMIVCLLAIIAL